MIYSIRQTCFTVMLSVSETSPGRVVYRGVYITVT